MDLTTAFFLSKLFQWKSPSRRIRCFYSRQRTWFLGRQRSRAGRLEIICNEFNDIFVILCSIGFSETLIVSTLRKPQYIGKHIKEGLIKVLFNLFNQTHCITILSTLKSSQVFVVNLS